MFLYKERRQIWTKFDSKNSIWRRICYAFKIFDNIDLSSRSFRNKALKDKGDIDIVQSIGISDASPNTNCLTSPTSCSIHTEPEYTSSEYSGTPPRIFFIPSEHGKTFFLVETNEQIGHPNPNQEGPRAQEIAHENYQYKFEYFKQ